MATYDAAPVVGVDDGQVLTADRLGRGLLVCTFSDGQELPAGPSTPATSDVESREHRTGSTSTGQGPGMGRLERVPDKNEAPRLKSASTRLGPSQLDQAIWLGVQKPSFVRRLGGRPPHRCFPSQNPSKNFPGILEVLRRF